MKRSLNNTTTLRFMQTAVARTARHIAPTWLDKRAVAAKFVRHSSSRTTTRGSTSTTTAASRGKQWMEQIQARVFCPEQEGLGGNPVTIFAPISDDEEEGHSTVTLSPKTQQQLAQSCDWESVVVSQSASEDGDSTSHQSTLSFFMPTGQEVSFCAHAAMAGSIRVAQEMDQVTPLHFHMMSSQNDAKQQSASAIVHEDDCVTLIMPQTTFSQSPVENTRLLYRLLRTHCGLTSEHLQTPDPTFPTFVNSDVAGGRPKTLVYVNDIKTLNEVCQAPTDPAGFERSLRMLREDTAYPDTTGLYLYTKHNDLDATYVCRQFPIASGYPEDAATGIAAAALAASLETELPFIKFEQGEAMGQPSLILVEDLKYQHKEEEPAQDSNAASQQEQENPTDTTTGNDEEDDPSRAADQRRLEEMEAEHESKFRNVPVSYKLLGKIEIDNREEIEVDMD